MKHIYLLILLLSGCTYVAYKDTSMQFTRVSVGTDVKSIEAKAEGKSLKVYNAKQDLDPIAGMAGLLK